MEVYVKMMLFCCLLLSFVTMICGFCGKNTEGVQNYIRHISLVHRGDPNFHMICGINGCVITYKRFSSFTSHIYRKHRVALDSIDTQTQDEGISDKHQSFHYAKTVPKKCCFCEFSFSKCNELISHLGKHLNEGKQVDCPMKHCQKVYSVFTSFTSHLSRCHKNASFELIKDCYIIVLENVSANDMNMEESLQDNNCMEGLNDLPDLVERDQYETEFRHSLFQSFLKLQEFSHLPVSTVDKMVEEMKVCFTLSTDFTKRSILMKLKDAGISDDISNKIAQNFDNDIFTSAVSMLDTSYKRSSYLQKHYPLVKPLTIGLGKNSKHVTRTYQYIPVLESLKNMLYTENFLAAVMEGDRNAFSRNVLFDFEGGSYYKDNALFSSGSATLQIVLYFDEFEVVNPLGSQRGKQKLGAVYMSLGNIPVLQRSDLKTIQLCLLCPVIDIKEFGINKVLEPLVFDLKILESEGIFVSQLNRHIKGTVAYISADNLGSHQIGGFLESFGPNVARTCRFCMAHSDETQDCFEPSCFQERDKDTYDFHVNEVSRNSSLASEYGIKKGSVLNELQYFHVTKGLPPDIMHDLLEGCVKKEVSLVLKKFVSDSLVTESDILRNIQNFKYGKCDRDNKPAMPKALTVVTNQTATQMWTLFRFLPLMLGHLIPEGNEHWEILLLLKDITEIVMSSSIDKKLCPFLQSLISDHHLLLKQCFPDFRLTPKHHFITHYPQLLLRYGPLRACWCMRFEGKHSYFKQLSLRLKNFKNLASTLAIRHQNLQAYICGSDKGYFKPGIEISNCKTFLEGVDYDVLNRLLRQKDISPEGYFFVKNVAIQGTHFNIGSFILTGFTSDEPQMSKVKYIVVKMETSVFLCTDYTSSYDRHLRAYELTESANDVVAYLHDDLLDYVPLSAYRIRNKQYIVLKHFILNKEAE